MKKFGTLKIRENSNNAHEIEEMAYDTLVTEFEDDDGGFDMMLN